ncbi:MAG: hypothetical protein R3C11_21110 [Planctomycetaceae bacterium]
MRPELGKGTVLQNNTPAYMGSAVGELNTGVHTKLSKNDEVTVLEKVTVNTQRGPVEMYKITPPAYEYRWIEGHSLIAADQYQEEAQDSNPFTIQQEPTPYNEAPQYEDPFSKTASVTQKPVAEKQAVPAPSNSKGVRRSAPPVAEVEADRQALNDLDTAFSEMIEMDPREWDLDGLEAAYQELQSHTKYQVLASQVDLRLSAVTRYRKIKAQYDDFIQLTSATSEREAELLNQQQQVAQTVGTSEPTIVSDSETMVDPQASPQLTGPMLAPGPNPVELGSIENSQPLAGATATGKIVSHPNLPRLTAPQGDLIGGPPGISSGTGMSGPVLGEPVMTGPELAPAPQNSSEQIEVATPQPIAQTDGSQPHFDGAGIIQRTLNPREGLPQHVLVSPEGKIISYVQPRGNLDLDSFVGQSMGIQGEVSFRQDLNRHVLVIDRMMPVQLTR